MSTQIVWTQDFRSTNVAQTDVRLIKLNSDGSSNSVLIGPVTAVDSDNQTNFQQTFKLKEGDVIQLTVTPGGAVDARTSFAEMTVRFISG